jgi:DNA-binding LacI/PurR family transcriptional regulator
VELLRSGHWGGAVPGVVEIARHFNVSKFSARGALKILESEGVLYSRGAGRSRDLVSAEPKGMGKTCRVGILPTVPLHQEFSFVQNTIGLIQSEVEKSGHHCFISSRALSQLGNDPARVLRHIGREHADAWIVNRARRDILTALAEHPTPVYAMGGYFTGLPIAGSVADIVPALRQAIDELVALGHRKIVSILPTRWRVPEPIPTAQALLDILRSKGIPVGDYNMPDWKESPEGLSNLLESMFQVTPPTALIVVEPAQAVGVLSFLARKKLRVPEDVSLLSMIIDPIQEWHQPPITKLMGPIEQQHVRHTMRWINKVVSGKVWHNQLTLAAKLHKGGTFGKASK